MDWIVYIRASDHMPPYSHVFTTKHTLLKPIQFKLLDGHLKHVSTIGIVIIKDSIMLTNVLFVPEFHYNLLFVNLLLTHHNLCAYFTHDGYSFEDWTSKSQLEKAIIKCGLYVIKSQPSFKSVCSFLKSANNSQSSVSFLNEIYDKVSLELLHNHLGYVSLSKLKYLSCFKNLELFFSNLRGKK